MGPTDDRAEAARLGPGGRNLVTVLPFLITTMCWIAAAVAMITALGKFVYDLTQRELDLGWLGLVAFAPSAFLVLLTGSIADRHDRRRVAAMGFGVEAILIMVLAWYVSTDPSSVGPVFVLVFCFGVARAFAMPSVRSLPGDIVRPENLPWLTVRTSGTIQAGMIVGPVVGGLAYAIDPVVPFVMVAALLGIGAVSVLMVKSLPPELVRLPAELSDEMVVAEAALETSEEFSEGDIGPAPGIRTRFRDAAEGFRFIKTQPVLLGAISLDLFAVLFGGAVALLPAIAEDRLGTDALGLGFLRAAVGVGATAMTLYLMRRPIRRNVGKVLLVAVALFGVFTIVLGVTTSYVVAWIALATLSACDAISVFVRGTLAPLVTPRDKRGRVLAIEMVFVGASNELGGFESGATGQLLGPAGAVVLGGACTIVIAGTWWVVFPALRDVDRFPGLEEPGGDTPTRRERREQRALAAADPPESREHSNVASD